MRLPLRPTVCPRRRRRCKRGRSDRRRCCTDPRTGQRGRRALRHHADREHDRRARPKRAHAPVAPCLPTRYSYVAQCHSPFPFPTCRAALLTGCGPPCVWRPVASDHERQGHRDRSIEGKPFQLGGAWKRGGVSGAPDTDNPVRIPPCRQSWASFAIAGLGLVGHNSVPNRNRRPAAEVHKGRTAYAVQRRGLLAGSLLSMRAVKPALPYDFARAQQLEGKNAQTFSPLGLWQRRGASDSRRCTPATVRKYRSQLPHRPLPVLAGARIIAVGALCDRYKPPFNDRGDEYA